MYQPALFDINISISWAVRYSIPVAVQETINQQESSENWPRAELELLPGPDENLHKREILR
jgi:hypothetical protein